MYTIEFALFYVFPLLLVDLPGGLVDRVQLAGGITPISFANVPFVIALAYFSVVCGFYVTQPRVRPRRAAWPNVLGASRRPTTRKLTMFAFFLCLSAFAAFLLRAQDYGGLAAFTRMRYLIRLQMEDAAQGNTLIERLFPGASVAYVLLLARCICTPPGQRFRLASIGPFAFAIATTVLIGFSGGGRGYLVFPFVIYPIICLAALKNEVPKWALAWGIPIALLVIITGKPIFALVAGIAGTDNLADVLVGIAQQQGDLTTLDRVQGIAINFQHWVFAVPIALEYVSDPSRLRWFQEVVLGLVALVPSSLGFFPVLDDIQLFHTDIVFGSADLVKSRLPPGWVAYAIYSLHLPGVIIYGLFTGMVGRFVEDRLRPLVAQHWFFLATYVLFIELWAFQFQGGDWMNFYRVCLIQLAVLVPTLVAPYLRTRGFRTASPLRARSP